MSLPAICADIDAVEIAFLVGRCGRDLGGGGVGQVAGT